MSIAPIAGRPSPSRHRRRRVLIEAGSAMLGIVLLIWSLLPVYQMLLIALDPEEGEVEFTGNLWPAEPSLDGFRDVVTQKARYLEDFWHQFGNSLPCEAARLACAAVRELDAVLFRQRGTRPMARHLDR